MATTPATRSRWGTLFTVVALGEAFTWAGLLIGMFLKHVTQTTDVGVAVFGALHGGMFLVYMAVTLVVAWRLRWPLWVALVGLLAGIPPLATVPFDLWVARRGLIRPR